jgi:hypothetical protein
VASKEVAPGSAAPPSGGKWAGSISTIASALLALASLYSLFFGAKPHFPPWFLYALTVLMAWENFADFVRRYSIFYDEINGKLGSSARAHFEIPKPLSY